MKLGSTHELGKTVPSAETVLLVRGGALGDFVLTLPVAAALRATARDARLIVAGHPGHAALAAPAAVIDADSADWARFFGGGSKRIRRRLPNCRRVVAYVAGTPSPAFMEALHGICTDVRIADPRPRDGDRRHVAAQLLDPLRPDHPALPLCPAPRIPLPPTPCRDLVVIHPGSGSPGKCWPPGRFAVLVQALQDRGQACAVLWGPVEAERAASLDLPAAVPRLAPASPLDLARQLAGARLFVGNDSGPGHVAAAVGVPTISLFGPTDPSLWRPLGSAATWLRAPQGDLTRLDVDCVLEAVGRVLGTGPTRDGVAA